MFKLLAVESPRLSHIESHWKLLKEGPVEHSVSYTNTTRSTRFGCIPITHTREVTATLKIRFPHPVYDKPESPVYFGTLLSPENREIPVLIALSARRTSLQLGGTHTQKHGLK